MPNECTVAFADPTKLSVVQDEIGVDSEKPRLALRSHVLSLIREISNTHTQTSSVIPRYHAARIHTCTRRSQPTASSLCHEFPIDSRRFEFHASQIQPHADICGQIVGYRRVDASWLSNIHLPDEIEVRKKRWKRERPEEGVAPTPESFGSAD
ncbi:hypothetical protein K0M31_003821 [Melipona bicolor]|uniref:Uncharacterized protein n=1 Tax=Melipona bicolor TaxID=60889 RepID=A0AA40KNZ7_9HYME|nr:hypothetical protein K0M31_003821 [Melipona bicolor]